MRGQSHISYCGPACVANALASIHARWANVTENDVAKRIRLTASIAETDVAAGTVEHQIARAFAAYKVKVEQVSLHQPHAAVCALRGQLLVGRPALLAVDNDEHWILVNGLLGESFLVVDPADPELVTVYNGERLANRWKLAGDPPRYYALVVHGRTR